MTFVKTTVLILFFSFFIATHAFLQSLGGGMMSGVRDTIKSFESLNPFTSLLNKDAAKQEGEIINSRRRMTYDKTDKVKDLENDSLGQYVLRRQMEPVMAESSQYVPVPVQATLG